MQKYIVVLILAACLLFGCEPGTRRTIGNQETPVSGQISKMELRDELNRFEFYFMTSMKQAASEINAASTSQRSQRTNLQMRTRILEAVFAMTSSDDPIVAFFDTWSLIIRLRYYLEEGDGKTLHGDQQAIAVKYIQQADDEITNIARMFLKPEQFDKIRTNLQVFAQKYPITGTYGNLIVYATQEEAKEVGPFLQTLSIPMAPIRAMEGVDNTADAINRVRDSVDRFTDMAQQLPETSRWQLSILMDDFEESEMTQSFLTSLSQFSQSTEQLVDTLNGLPQEIRTEALTVLEKSEQSQQQLQATMKTATETAERLEVTLSEFHTLTQAMNDMAAEAGQTATDWQNASESIQELVLLFKDKTPPGPDDPPPFGMRDFNNMLTNAGQTADKVATAAAQIQTTIDTGKTTAVQNEINSFIDRITWRLFQLILVIFGLLVIFILIKHKLKAA